MTVVLTLTLVAFVGLALVIAGLMTLRKPEAKPHFAKIRNGYLPDIGQRKRH